MERPTLLVLKGSRVREYLQQNQRLLAALPGQRTRTRYNRTWISDRVDLNLLETGLPALILFSDQPYETLCPVRHARLESYRWERDYLELDLRLEDFVAPELVALDLRDHLHGWPHTPFDDGGRKCFLDLSPMGWSLPRAQDEAAAETAWRRTVDFLVESPEEAEFYRHAVFFRPVGLYEEEERAPAGATATAEEGGRGGASAGAAPRVEGGGPGPEAPLEHAAGEDEVDLLADVFAGYPPHEHANILAPLPHLAVDRTYCLELSAHNPHLSEEELRYIRLAPDGRGALSFLRDDGAFPSLVQDGWLTLKFVARGTGRLALELSVTGWPETSAFFVLRAQVTAGEQPVEPGGADAEAAEPSARHLHLVEPEQAAAAPSGESVGEAVQPRPLLPPTAEPLEPSELLRLEAWLGERLGLERKPREHLALFREFLGRWAPWSTAVAERQAALAFEQEEWAEVERLLRDREGLSEEARHRRFLAGLEERHLSDVAAEAAALGWTGEYDPYFEHFLRLVPELPAETRRELADRLPFAIWGDEKSCRFLQALMNLEPDGDLVEIITAALDGHAELFDLSADDILAWLVARLRTLDRPSPYLIRELVDWIPTATRDDEAVDFLAKSLLPQLYREEGSGPVREVMESLKGQLDLAQRLTLGRAVVALHLEEENPHPGPEEGVNAAVLRLTELLRETREAADAYEAEELARRLATVLEERGTAVDAVVAGWAREELDAFEAFLTAWEPHRAKILEDVEQKALDLAERWRGRTVHVFSGHDGSLEERFARLEELLGLEVTVHGWEERGVLDGLQMGRDVVLILPRWAGHPDTEAVEEACRKRTVECHILPQRTVNPERVVLEVWGRERG